VIIFALLLLSLPLYSDEVTDPSGVGGFARNIPQDYQAIDPPQYPVSEMSADELIIVAAVINGEYYRQALHYENLAREAEEELVFLKAKVRAFDFLFSGLIIVTILWLLTLLWACTGRVFIVRKK
jgi:hypothetical protein